QFHRDTSSLGITVQRCPGPRLAAQLQMLSADVQSADGPVTADNDVKAGGLSEVAHALYCCVALRGTAHNLSGECVSELAAIYVMSAVLAINRL
ncbi:hypothetical protein J6590_047908, partial [Homalodisca vitripennis]